MMPFCEYRKCKRVADDTPTLLRQWSSFSQENQNHHQEIWLCNKHIAKINELLGLRPKPVKQGEGI